HSANGTRVNGVRIQEAVPLSSGDVVRIGDYGVALRPDDAPLDVPVLQDPMEDTAPVIPTEVIADTAPHPLVPAAPEAPAIPDPTRAGARRTSTPRCAGVGLVIGPAVALCLPSWPREQPARPRQVAPPPDPPAAASQELPPPAAS